MADNGWIQPTDAERFFGQSEKRLGYEERRPRISKASDLLGPLSGPSAILINDSMNSDLLAFNGLFIVPPGTPESPDPLLWWVGESIAQDGIGGTHTLATFQLADAPHRVVMRGWETIPGTGGLRSYSAWQDIGTPPTIDVSTKRRLTAAQSISDGTATTILNMTTSVDADVNITYSAGAGTFTFDEDAKILAVATIAYPANATGVRATQILLNGVQAGIATMQAHGSIANRCIAPAPLSVVAGDVLEMQAYQTSGGPLNANASETQMAIAKIGEN